MSGRKPPKVISGLFRYLHSIFGHYHDRGMPQNAARLKMLDETYTTIRQVVDSEKDVPDHMLAITVEHTIKHMRQRGKFISEHLPSEKNPQKIEIMRDSLRQIKATMDQLEAFVENYKGAGDGLGKERNEHN